MDMYVRAFWRVTRFHILRSEYDPFRKVPISRISNFVQESCKIIYRHSRDS